MRKKLSLISLLVAATLPVWAGTGTYTDGDPDTIELRVMFMYDEQDPTAWEDLFKEGSRLLYNATEKQVRFSKIIFYNNCPDADGKADVKIHDDTMGARAHVGGLGRAGYRVRLSQTHKTVTTSGSGDRGQLGLVHELGHYAFGNLDEYLNKAGDRTSDAFCIDQNGTTASIMDSGTTVDPENQRHEFCWADNHRTGKTKQDKKRKIGDTEYEDTDSWTWLAAYVDHHYGATLTVPTADPTDDVSGHGDDPEFEYHDCGLRAVTCIDRSGSMGLAAADRIADGAGPYEGTELARRSPRGTAPIDLAKQGASNFINLLTDADRAAVTSFASDVTVNYPMDDMNDTNQASALSAIGTIQAGGQTNIGGGLQTSLSQITGDGLPTASEVIVLLSDGMHNTGTDPQTVLPALQQRGVVVHTIGLGSVDAALMSRIASETGGKYLFATSPAQLNAHFIQLLREARSQGLVEGEEGELGGGEDASFSVPLDSFTGAEAARFVLVWNEPSVEFAFALERPDGTPVLPSDPDVEFQYDPLRAFKQYTISNPQTGDWSASIGNPEVAASGYTLQVISTSTLASLSGFAEQEIVTFPQPFLLRATVLADAAVAGADVTATVIRPNGAPVPIRLYDDGSLAHGDDASGDGIYSAIFNGFFGDGSYTVNLRADTEGGVTADEGEDGPVVDPEPVERFVRETVFSAVVDGMAAADGDLDGVLDVEEEGAPGGGDGNGDGTPDELQSDVASVLRAADGQYLTLQSTDAGCGQLTGVSSGLPSPELEGQDLVYGTVSFLLECAGGVVEITLHGADTLDGLRVFRYGPTPANPTDHWYEFDFDGLTGAEIANDRVIVHLADDERGDDDLTPNGLVVVRQLAFARGQPTPVIDIPTLSTWGLVALVALLAIAAVRRQRRALRGA